MSLRDVCDLSLAWQMREARQERQTMALAALMGGGDYQDPVRLLLDELDAPLPHERSDAELLSIFGL